MEFSKTVAIVNSLYNTFTRFFNHHQTSNDLMNELNDARESCAKLLASRSKRRILENDSEALRNQIIDAFIIQGCYYDIFMAEFADDENMVYRLNAAYNQIVKDLTDYKTSKCS